MRLLVLGATGKTGASLVVHALARDHFVTTFGRSRFDAASGSKLRIATGNPLNSDELTMVMPGHDAVLSAIGSRGLGATTVRADSARAVIDGMHRTNLKRLIILSSSLVDANLRVPMRWVARTLLRNVANDQRVMENAVTSSDLKWTVVRPGRLTNGTPTSRYETIPVSQPGDGTIVAMSRDDAAAAMLDIAEREQHIRQVVWLRGATA